MNEMFTEVVIQNGQWTKDISPDIIEASLDMGTDEVAEINIVVDDPNWTIFGASNLPLKAPVNFRDLRLSVAKFEANSGGGEGGFTITARPALVRSLKDQKDAKILYNISPSRFVYEEVIAVGGACVAQDSAQRTSVARDVTVVGQQGNADTSAWSTMSRLADELGYIVFENAGTVYFGKPSWLVSVLPTVKVTWGQKDSGYEATEIPTCSRSLDDNGRASVELKVPIERADEFRPGRGLLLEGIPQFGNGEKFMIKTVSFPLAGAMSEVIVTAETPYDPEANPPEVVD